MQAYICTVCEYLYNEQSVEKNEENVQILFENLDDEWRCPNCGVRANLFKKISSEEIPDIPNK